MGRNVMADLLLESPVCSGALRWPWTVVSHFRGSAAWEGAFLDKGLVDRCKGASGSQGASRLQGNLESVAIPVPLAGPFECLPLFFGQVFPSLVLDLPQNSIDFPIQFVTLPVLPAFQFGQLTGVNLEA